MSRSNVANDARATVEAWVRAVVNGDAEAVADLFLPETTLFDLGLPLRQKGVAAVKARFEAWIAGYALGKGPGFEFIDLEVFAGEEVGYATGINHVFGELKSGESIDMYVRTTLGLQKIEGVWNIAHEHMSVPIDFETLKASFDLKP